MINLTLWLNLSQYVKTDSSDVIENNYGNLLEHAQPYLLFPPGIPCSFHICRTVTVWHCSTNILYNMSIKKQPQLINCQRLGLCK